jgi:hypothetical protein
MGRAIEPHGGEVYRLSDEERTAVRAGMDDARRDEFASDEEINELCRLHQIPGGHSGA